MVQAFTNISKFSVKLYTTLVPIQDYMTHLT